MHRCLDSNLKVFCAVVHYLTWTFQAQPGPYEAKKVASLNNHFVINLLKRLLHTVVRSGLDLSIPVG